jgi:hypothetical protein
MAQYVLAQLHGGRLNGQLLHAALKPDSQWPADVIGVPVPHLDEATEPFWWDTGDYFLLAAASPPKRGGHWWYSFARTWPGYPSASEDR